MTDLTDLKTPFGLLDDATREALKAHGGPLQFLNYYGKWQTIDAAEWQANSTYRVKPQPPKPREWWLIREAQKDGFIVLYAPPSGPWAEIIHVREVTD